MDKLSESQLKEVLEKKITADMSLVYHMCRCLEVSQKRGAYNANELSYVGSLYDKLGAVLNEAVEEVTKSKEDDKLDTITENSTPAVTEAPKVVELAQ